MILLSILIPTVVGREEQLSKLYLSLLKTSEWTIWKQFKDKRFQELKSTNGELEIITCKDNKEISIGLKRELLYAKAKGLYSIMIDDDDLLADNAIELILESIKSNPDCICFKELVNIDGVISHSNFSLRYGDWEGDGSRVLEDGFTYHRTPFFKTPIKTEICRSVGVKPLRFAEDHDFAQRIKPVLKTEVYIDEFLYHYIHVSTPFNERYGIK